MEQRVHKLLIMIGEEGAGFENRDFKKLSEVVGEYLSQNNLSFKQYFSQIFVKVIRLIPQKHHFYAGLTASIARSFSDLSSKLIDTVLLSLQTALSQAQLSECTNILKYLAELLNISLLSSLTFMNIIEDLLRIAQNEGETVRVLIGGVVSKGLWIGGHSLSQKMDHQFKKVMEKVRKCGQGDELVQYIYQLTSKGKLPDKSQMSRLGADFSSLNQYHSKFKLTLSSSALLRQLSLPESYSWEPIEQDQLYQEYKKGEGLILKNDLWQLIQVFSGNGEFLLIKIVNLIADEENTFRLRLVLESLIGKALKSKHPLAQYSMILLLVQHASLGEESVSLIQSNLAHLFNLAESFDLAVLQSFAKLITFIVNNWSGDWDWEPLVGFGEESRAGWLKRQVLIRLIVERLSMLDDKLILGKAMAAYAVEKGFTSQEEYKTTEDLETFENFTNQLKMKTQANHLIPMITSERTYSIFLEALFQRTSLSQTHLSTLVQRYQPLLKHFANWDWTLINKIRNFFKLSFFHRLFYLRHMILKQILGFQSYVKYIGGLGEKTPIEMIWIKLQVIELNAQFGKTLKK